VAAPIYFCLRQWIATASAKPRDDAVPGKHVIASDVVARRSSAVGA
jgi:hypothetical protein